MSPDDSEHPRPSLLANTALAWLMFTGRAAASLITTVLVARSLGPAGRGEVSYVVNLSGLLALLATSGTAAAMLRAVRLGHTSSRELHRLALEAGAVFGTLPVAGLLIAAAVDGTRRTELTLVAIALVPLIVQANAAQAAALDDRLRAVTWTSLLAVSVYAVATAVQAATGTATVTSNLVLWIASTAVGAILLVWALRHRFTPRRRGTLGWLVRRSAAAATASSAVLALWRADVVIVRAERGLVELGQYAVAVGCAEVLSTLAMGVAGGLLPSMAADDDATEIVCRATRLMLVGLAVLGTCMVLIAPWAVPTLFGAQYAESSRALAVLVPGVVCLVLHVPLFNFLAGHGRTPQLTALTLAVLAVNVGANLLVLQHVGYIAAAAVSTATYGGLFAGCVALFTRVTGTSVRALVVVERRDVSDARAAVRTALIDR
jgi:O-antigen/teichoic acid export membrane protein